MWKEKRKEINEAEEMIIGLLTRYATLGFLCVMIGAIYLKMTMNVPFSTGQTTGWEFDTMILGASLALFFLGAGRLSLDAMIWGKKNQ